jgi:hypothetical protein
VRGPTLIRTLVTVPVPGTSRVSRMLRRPPLVVQLHEATRWKKIRLWQLAVLFALRLRFAPKSRALAFAGTASARIASAGSRSERLPSITQG